jgi:beta-lactamase regulating signal transducer with metallopeptidase domain/HEAT repeat protein
MRLISDIIALPGWNTSMLMLLAKATLILVAALTITIAMQRASAGSRHLVWLITLGALLLVPALATFTPLRLEILPAPARPSVLQNGDANASTSAPAPILNTTQSSTADLAATDTRGFRSATVTSVTNGFFASISGFALMMLIWATITLAITAWLAWGALTVRRIIRSSHALDSQDWLTPLYEVSDRLELDEPPRLLSSDDAKMPFACGFLTPTIVLPAECQDWTEDRRRAVLLHELAHVRRHDLLGHTLGRIACAVYWFHPLVWTAAKKLRNESERACDDLALSCGARASDYAEHLLDIVTSVRHDSTPAVAMAMARRKEFEGRMLAILDPQLRHTGPGRRQSAALIASLAVISIVVGAAAPAPRPVATVRAAAKAPVTMISHAPADFTPHDVASPAPAKSADRKIAAEPGVADSDVKTVSEQVANENTVKPFGKIIGDNVARALSSVDEKSIAAAALERLGSLRPEKGNTGPDDRPALLANILKTDTSASIRRIAAWGLSDYADSPVAYDALAAALRSDTDARVREMAAWALGNGDQRGAGVTTALISALKSDSKEAVRVTAAWALGSLGDRSAVDALTAATTDASAAVRLRAIWAIGSVGPRTAPVGVINALKDTNPEVRELAAWALYTIEDPAAAPALNAALSGETNKTLQIAYIRALASMGEKSVDAIRGLLTSSDPRIKSMAVRALAGGNATGPWPWPWPEPRPNP